MVAYYLASFSTVFQPNENNKRVVKVDCMAMGSPLRLKRFQRDLNPGHLHL